MRGAVAARRLSPVELRVPAVPLLALVLLAAMLAGVSAGAVPISPVDTLRALLGGEADEASPAAILLSLRVPRVALAAVIGAVLGLSGAAMQAAARCAIIARSAMRWLPRCHVSAARYTARPSTADATQVSAIRAARRGTLAMAMATSGPTASQRGTTKATYRERSAT